MRRNGMSAKSLLPTAAEAMNQTSMEQKMPQRLSFYRRRALQLILCVHARRLDGSDLDEPSLESRSQVVAREIL